MSDASAIFAALKRVCKHYTLDFDEVLQVCKLSSLKKEKEPRPAELELARIGNKNYLKDPKTLAMFSNETDPKLIGYLCPNSNTIIRV